MNPIRASLADEQATRAFGAALAPLLPGRATVFLQGNLGAGKTTLVRALLRAAGHDGPVRSPTYTLVEPYRLARGSYYHLDLYRLSDPEELEYLGLRDMLAEDCVLLIEWPERGEAALPRPDLRIRLESAGSGRMLEVEAASPVGADVLERLGRP